MLFLVVSLPSSRRVGEMPIDRDGTKSLFDIWIYVSIREMGESASPFLRSACC